VAADRRNSTKILVRDQPLVDTFADWASKSDANETSTTVCADAAVDLAVAVWTSESKRIFYDLRSRYCAATSIE
jgi:hypothetical protein